jgi:gamma-glutamylcyclotransferase
MTLYFAYGSNLNLRQMQYRCPAATPLDKVYLRGTRLVFRGVADVVFEDDATCPGGIWDITEECEDALDRYEGCNDQGTGMYRKEYIDVPGFGETLVYVMNSTGICPPSVGYYNGIVQGYRDFGLSLRRLKIALKHSHDAKHLSHVERKRLRRNGRPALKSRPVPRKLSLPAKPKEAVKVARAKPVDMWSADVPAEKRRRTNAADLTAWLQEKREEGRRV